MSAHEGRQSRLEQAKKIASDVVQGLNGNQRAAVATAGEQLRYRSHLTDNPRELLEAIESVEPSVETLAIAALPSSNWNSETPEGTSAPEDKPPREGETSVGQSTPKSAEPQSTSSATAKSPTVSPSLTAVSNSAAYRTLLISDAGFDPTELPSHIELLKVGTPLENVGIVSADMAYLAGDTGRLGIYYQIASTFPTEQKVDLTLSSIDNDGRERIQKIIPVTAKPGTNAPETFELADAPPGRWVARLDLADALDEDNTAFLAVELPEPIRVQVESPDPFFLENSIHAFAQGQGLLTLVKEKASVVLAKSVAPKSDFAIIFQPSGDSEWWTSLGEETEAGAARVLVENHPVLRHLDATSIPFVGARQITPPPGAQVLVADDKGLPLIYKTRKGSRSAVVVNMDPVAAEFYFSAWFPVLVHSAVTHLAGRENLLAASYRPGEAVPIPAGRDDVVTKVGAPHTHADQKASHSTAHQETKGPWFRGIDHLGFYTMENSAGKHTVGASLFSPAESLLNNSDVVDHYDPLSRGRSPAAWLTIIAIVALAAESILYHRRKVG